jgi:hypothetical protein
VPNARARRGIVSGNIIFISVGHGEEDVAGAPVHDAPTQMTDEAFTSASADERAAACACAQSSTGDGLYKDNFLSLFLALA